MIGRPPTGRLRIDLRPIYAHRFAARRAALQQFARDQRLRLVSLTTADDPFAVLQRALG